MIYNKSIYNKVISLLLIIAGLVMIILLVFILTEYRISKKRMERMIPPLFEQAIKDEVDLKMNNVFMDIYMKNDPYSKKEKVRKHTITMEDTVITKEFEMNPDMNNMYIESSQTYLLHKNRLYPDTLQQLFDVTLDENGIKARSFILVHHEQDSEMSGDTTGYRINYRTPIIKGGVFGEITYQGLLNYSQLAVFRLMPKNAIISLFILEVLMLGIVCYVYVEKRKIKSDKITKRGRHYYIGETIFNTRKNELITQKKIAKIPHQPATILLMILESDDWTLDKNEFKEKFWPKIDTADKRLMSAVNKLRNCLKDVDCKFNIVTTKGDNSYMLKYIEHDTETNEVE